MPARRVILAHAVDEQVADALNFTLERFGARKLAEYQALIAEALEKLATGAETGQQRPDIAADAWAMHIGRRRARHLFLYRIAGDDVHVLHFAYDGMDLPARWQDSK